MAIPILLDCDPGHDDAVAMLLAAADDAIDLVAVTTVAGNCSLDLATLNARRVAALAGLDGVPIAAGAAGPLQGELVTAPESTAGPASTATSCGPARRRWTRGAPSS